MIRRCAGLLVAGLLLGGLSGCAVLLLGGGAAAGYAIGKDSVTDHFDVSQRHVYGVSRAVLKDKGLISSENAEQGYLKGTVEGMTVTITVKPVSKKTVKLTVKARDKFLMPKVAVAQDVYQAIKDRL